VPPRTAPQPRRDEPSGGVEKVQAAAGEGSGAALAAGVRLGGRGGGGCRSPVTPYRAAELELRWLSAGGTARSATEKSWLARVCVQGTLRSEGGQRKAFSGVPSAAPQPRCQPRSRAASPAAWRRFDGRSGRTQPLR